MSFERTEMPRHSPENNADYLIRTNITVDSSNSKVSPAQLPPLPANQNLPAAPIDSSIDKWFFISGASA